MSGVDAAINEKSPGANAPRLAWICFVTFFIKSMLMFLYYIPNKPQFTRTEAQSHPVLGPLIWDLCKTDFLFQTRIVQHAVLNNGPDNGAGLLLIASPKDGLPDGFRIGYYPDDQAWVKISGQDYWIGYATQPSEIQLRREYIVEGEDHELANGESWVCPIVRKRGKVSLPSKWGIDAESGEFSQVVLANYADAWKMACEAWDHVMGDTSIEKPRAFEICVCALAVNYRIGPIEASILGLIDDTNYDKVFGALIDRTFWETTLQERREKKA